MIGLIVPLPSDSPPIRSGWTGYLQISISFISGRSQLSTFSTGQSHPVVSKVLPEEIFSVRCWHSYSLSSSIVSGGGRSRPLMPAIRSSGSDFAVIICFHFMVDYVIPFAACSRRTSGWILSMSWWTCCASSLSFSGISSTVDEISCFDSNISNCSYSSQVLVRKYSRQVLCLDVIVWVIGILLLIYHSLFGIVGLGLLKVSGHHTSLSLFWLFHLFYL